MYSQHNRLDVSSRVSSRNQSPPPAGLQTGRRDEAAVRNLQTPPPPGFANGVSSLPVGSGRSDDDDGSSLRLIGSVPTTTPYSNSGKEAAINGHDGFDKRTTSFTNLAAVFGTGLAESMDDSTREMCASAMAPFPEASKSALHRTANEIVDRQQDLNHARQSRHAASRLIGTNGLSGPSAASGTSCVTVAASALLPPLTSISSQKNPQHLRKNSSTQEKYSSLTTSFPAEQPLTTEFKSRESTLLSVVRGSPKRGGLPTSGLGVKVVEPMNMGRCSAPPQFTLGGETLTNHYQITQRPQISVDDSIPCSDRSSQSVSAIDPSFSNLTTSFPAEQPLTTEFKSRESTLLSVVRGSPKRGGLPTSDLGVKVVEPMNMGRCSAPPQFTLGGETLTNHYQITQRPQISVDDSIPCSDRSSQRVSAIDPSFSNLTTSFPAEKSLTTEFKSRESTLLSVVRGSPKRGGLPTSDLGVKVVEPMNMGRCSAPPQFTLGGETLTNHYQITQRPQISVDDSIPCSDRSSQSVSAIDPSFSNLTTSFPTEQPLTTEFKSRESTLLSVVRGSPKRGGLPTSDLGVKVVEPMSMGRCSAPPQFTLGGETLANHYQITQRPQISVDDSIPCSDRSSQSVSAIDPSFSKSPPRNNMQHRLKAELQPFIWDGCHKEPSRALVIIHTSAVHVPDVRSTCEAFGSLEVFCPDFSDWGIIFIGYYDIRSAQYAALELSVCLQRLIVPSSSSDSQNDSRTKFVVQYCVPLNSSSAQDESIIGLSNISPDTSKDTFTAMLASYGSVKSLHSQDEHYGASSYLVEFHSIQDAKQALIEWESTQPWGPNAIAEIGTRNHVNRKKGRELLALIINWRRMMCPTNTGNSTPERSFGHTPASSHSVSEGNVAQPRYTASGGSDIRTSSPSSITASSRKVLSASTSLSPVAVASDTCNSVHCEQRSTITNEIIPPLSQQTTQLGTDRNPNVAMNGAYTLQNLPCQQADSHLVQAIQTQFTTPHIMHGPHGTFVAHIPPSAHALSTGQYWPHPPPALSPHLATSFADNHSLPCTNISPYAVPFYARPAAGQEENIRANTDSTISCERKSTLLSSGVQVEQNAVPSRINSDTKEARHLILDIEAVEIGRDRRTSLMVRNIPNKYTQQRLLSEFTESTFGPGKIDFFYLPIDFKNKCNRGYAFVNFVDYRDIIPFYRQYYGQHWKVFNSGKICDITYARIQGKIGMLKRFENSALMQKDDKYRPLVFVSHGTKKGKQVQFPS